ncbi:YihY/virulence factor BrkB family protein, partial [Candidatus Latescibacterota bacterium]
QNEIKHLLLSTYTEWMKQKPLILGASIAFYFIFSLGPILVITVGIVSFFFGKQAAEGQIVQEIFNIIGDKPAEVIQSFIIQTHSPPTRFITMILSIPTIMFGSAMIFFQLKNTLNIVWDVKPLKEKRIYHIFIKYILSFSMVVFLGIILVLLISKSLLLVIFYDFIGQFFFFPSYLLYFIDTILTFLFMTLLFAMTLKVLPDTYIKWADVLTGALVTSFLFVIGQVIIGFYIGKTEIDTTYGALGSLTVLLIWIYYSSLIFLAGAVFTKIYSQSKQ